MLIQWFPGHMSKALKTMKDDLKLVDIVIYILDARAPYACLNPKFNELTENRKVIFVLNKSDMSVYSELNKWQEYFKSIGDDCLIINSVKTNECKVLEASILHIFEDRIKAKKEKGINLIVRAMIVGVPNSGKSTLLNNMCNKKKAQTGDKPGVTKSTQWVKIDNNIELLDTPGTLMPSFDDQELAKDLAYIGSIKDEILDLEELAFCFIEKMKKLDFNILKQRYDLETTEEDETIAIFDEICKRRNFILKGGESDYLRTAKAILDDFRKGRMGNIILNFTKDYLCLSMKKNTKN